MRTRPIGSVIGAIAGLAFVFINAWTVPAPLLWRLVAAIGFVAIMWFVVLRGPEVDQVPPTRSALRTYGISVAVMVVAIPLGASIITNLLDRPNAVLVWVVFVVGVHFFHSPTRSAYQSFAGLRGAWCLSPLSARCLRWPPTALSQLAGPEFPPDSSSCSSPQ